MAAQGGFEGIAMGNKFGAKEKEVVDVFYHVTGVAESSIVLTYLVEKTIERDFLSTKLDDKA